jgi:deoxyadenosine/deoxycytidine kinase
MAHIIRRGRDYERNIAPTYLEQLNRLYDAWIADWRACPVLHIDINGLDFLQNAHDLDMIIERIRQALAEGVC